jgi:ankyrin repeat protein
MAHQKKLWDSAQDGDLDKMELAIGCGANVNMPDEERFGATALHMAASNGHAKAIKVLAANEANINELDEDGFQAIHQAAKEGHADALCVLIEAKADPETPAMRGVRALHMASRYGHLNVVELLIEQKCQLRSLGDDGEQAIHHAAEKGHDAVVKCLVKANANVSIANAKGQTPLHLAAENRHAGVVATLLEEGADSNAVDENKKTPQDLAKANGHKNCVSVLKAFSPAPSQILHILSGIRSMVDDKLDKCEARLCTLEAKAGIEPCDGAPFAPSSGGGGDSAELAAELATTKEELAAALARIKELVPECPLDEKRKAASLALFTKLDEDVSGYLDVDEFTVIMRKLDPRIDQNGVINTFKKAGVQQALNIDQFYQWIHVMFGKADEATFDGLMTMFNEGT